MLQSVSAVTTSKADLLDRLSKSDYVSGMLHSFCCLDDEDIRHAVCAGLVRNEFLFAEGGLTKHLLRYSKDETVVSMFGAFLRGRALTALTQDGMRWLIGQLLATSRRRNAYRGVVLETCRGQVQAERGSPVFSALNFIPTTDGDFLLVARQRANFALRNGFFCEASGRFLARAAAVKE